MTFDRMHTQKNGRMTCGQCHKAWRQAAHDNADLAIARSQAWVSLLRQVYWAINAGHLDPQAILLFDEPAAKGLKELPNVWPFILEGSDWKPNDSGPTQSRRTKGGGKASASYHNPNDWSQWTGTGAGQSSKGKAYTETSGKGKGAGKDKGKSGGKGKDKDQTTKRTKPRKVKTAL